jgi:hypothetical protein
MACSIKAHKSLRKQIKHLERVQARYAVALELAADDDAPKYLKDADGLLDSLEHPERHTFYTLDEFREKLGIEPDTDVEAIPLEAE